MNEIYTPFIRSGSFEVKSSKEKIFPLLCPKMEEKWIPGWECEVIYSKSGYNEDGAIFKTQKPYGTELIWYTITFDMQNGIVNFLNFAKELFLFRFNIVIKKIYNEKSVLTFTQTFTPLSEKGIGMIDGYKNEDFKTKLSSLGNLIEKYLNKSV